MGRDAGELDVGRALSGWGKRTCAALVVAAALLALFAASVRGSDPIQVTSVTVGGSHACAIRTSGQAVCWGDNFDGQLGDGTETDRSSPTPVSGLDDAVAITAGGSHTCAIRESGQAVCWGHNFAGQLGDGTTQRRLVPTDVSSLDDAVEISAGGGYTCAIREGGQAVCWGYNGDEYPGQLGDGTSEGRLVPTNVSGMTDAISISASPDPNGTGGQTCAVRGDGEALCWGWNSFGQIGDGTEISRLVPTPVSGLSDATEISAGGYHSCAIQESGQVVCWGLNSGGQLGDGTEMRRLTPTSVPDLDDAEAISASWDNTCAIRESGQVVCWGRNGNGEVGDGSTEKKLSPTDVTDLGDALSISAGTARTCAVNSSAQALCWGGPAGSLTPTAVVEGEEDEEPGTEPSGGGMTHSDSSSPPSSTPALIAPPTHHKPASLHCRRGFEKKKVNGKLKCVRKSPKRKTKRKKHGRAGKRVVTNARLAAASDGLSLLSAGGLEGICGRAGAAAPKILDGGPWINHPGDRKTQNFAAEVDYQPLPNECTSFRRISMIKFEVQDPERDARWIDAGGYQPPIKTRDLQDEELEALEREREEEGRSCWKPIPGGEENTCRIDIHIGNAGGIAEVFFSPPRRLHEPSYSRHDSRLYRCTPGKGVTRVRALLQNTVKSSAGKVVARKVSVVPVRVRSYPGKGPMPNAWRGAVRGPC